MKTFLLIYALILAILPIFGMVVWNDFLYLYAVLLFGFIVVIVTGIWVKKHVQSRDEDEVSENVWNLYWVLWSEEIDKE